MITKNQNIHIHKLKKGIVKERIDHVNAHDQFKERKPRVFKFYFCAHTNCNFRQCYDMEQL